MKHCAKCEKKPETRYEQFMAEFKEQDKREAVINEAFALMFRRDSEILRRTHD